MRDKLLAVLSLFTSAGTLLCCALPVLLVTLGLGAAVAGTLSTFPWLAALSRHKGWSFLISGGLLALNWGMLLRRPASACPVPLPAGAGDSACATAGRFSRIVLWISAILFLIGFITAYLAFPLADRLGWV